MSRIPPASATAIPVALGVVQRESPAEAVRRKVVGPPAPLRTFLEAVHVLASPVDRATQLIDTLSTRIDGWELEGRPDTLDTGGETPRTLLDLRRAAVALGSHMEKRSTKAAVLADTPERRAELAAKFGELRQGLARLTGLRVVGGEANDLLEAVQKLDQYFSVMGEPVIYLDHTPAGQVSMIFGLRADVHRLRFFG